MIKRAIKMSSILALAALLIATFNAQAQERIKLQPTAQEFVVKGTSTLHDWHMTSSEGEGFMMLNAATNGVPNFSGAEIVLSAETLKSGKRGMDKNAYKALDTEEHPSIKFVLSSAQMESATSGKASGKLTIAGFTRDVTFNIEVKGGGNSFTIKGSTDFRLTDFQIDPPTALMGTIKTGDEVTIEFNTTFQN